MRQLRVAKASADGPRMKVDHAMIAADMDVEADLEETVDAVDAGAPAVAIAGAAAQDVMAANYQPRNTPRIAPTSRPNSRDPQNRLSQFCCPANRCQY